MWENPSTISSSFNSIISEMKKVFDQTVQGRDAGNCLFSLCQGPHSLAKFSIEFRTLAADSGWNDEALQSVFLKGFIDRVRDELAIR